MNSRYFFQGWSDLTQVIVVGTLAYLAVIVILRLSGKRTLAKLNAFDLVVTVSLGSLLSATITSDSVSLSEGVTAILLLVLLQGIITFLSVRFEAVQKMVKSTPQLLFYEGEMLKEVLKRERLSEEEVLVAMRENGQSSSHNVNAVVLETDGSLTVLCHEDSDADTLRDVHQPAEAKR